MIRSCKKQVASLPPKKSAFMCVCFGIVMLDVDYIVSNGEEIMICFCQGGGALDTLVRIV